MDIKTKASCKQPSAHMFPNITSIITTTTGDLQRHVSSHCLCLVTAKFLTTSSQLYYIKAATSIHSFLTPTLATVIATTMASTDESKPELSKTTPVMQPVEPTMAINLLFQADLVLRFFLFATTLISLVLMVTSKQTKLVNVPLYPLPVVGHAEFNYSPALIYFVVAISVALLHSVLTGLVSAFSIYKPAPATKLLVLAFLDSLILGVVASATGAVASIAYIGLKGNSHVYWNKICNVYDKFCRYAGSSVIISLMASIILVLLVMISTYSLYHRSK